jgi:hypothetical protein
VRELTSQAVRVRELTVRQTFQFACCGHIGTATSQIYDYIWYIELGLYVNKFVTLSFTWLYMH